jgi:plasmid maintenance system antidote protein VapI
MYAFRVSNDDPVDNGALLTWLAAGLDRRKGRTQAGLADVLGLSQPRISEILKGKRRIQAIEVPKIAKYIGQSPPREWLKTDLSPNEHQSDPAAKSRGEIRFGLHEDPNLVWILLFRDNKLIDQFEADIGDLDNLSRQVGRAIQSLPKPK